jgi:hypothetical protein
MYNDFMELFPFTCTCIVLVIATNKRLRCFDGEYIIGMHNENYQVTILLVNKRLL